MPRQSNKRKQPVKLKPRRRGEPTLRGLSRRLISSPASDTGHTQGGFALRLTGAGIAGGIGNSGADGEALAGAAACSRLHTTHDLQAGATDYPGHPAAG